MENAGTLTTLAHTDFLLMYGDVTQVHEKWPVLESRGSRLGFDREGNPVSSWRTDVPLFKIRSGKMAYKLEDGDMCYLQNTFIVEVHYDEAMDLHCRQMTHPLGSFGSMTCFDFSELAMTAAKEFLEAHKMCFVFEQLSIPFVRIIAEMPLA
jgi:hypothetical protein